MMKPTAVQTVLFREKFITICNTYCGNNKWYRFGSPNVHHEAAAYVVSLFESVPEENACALALAFKDYLINKASSRLLSEINQLLIEEAIDKTKEADIRQSIVFQDYKLQLASAAASKFSRLSVDPQSNQSAGGLPALSDEEGAKVLVSPKSPPIQVILYGEPRAGKTQLSACFGNMSQAQLFSESYQPTRKPTLSLLELSAHTGEAVRLQLCELSTTLSLNDHKEHFTTAAVICFCFDVNNAWSLTKLDTYVTQVRELLKQADLQIPLLLVGTKCEGKTLVSAAAINEFITKHSLNGPFYTSAQSKLGVDALQGQLLTIIPKLESRQSLTLF